MDLAVIRCKEQIDHEPMRFFKYQNVIISMCSKFVSAEYMLPSNHSFLLNEQSGRKQVAILFLLTLSLPQVADDVVIFENGRTLSGFLYSCLESEFRVS